MTLPAKIEEAISHVIADVVRASSDGRTSDLDDGDWLQARAALVAAIREYAADAIIDAFDCKACGGSGTQIINFGDHAEADGCCDPQNYQYTMKRLSKRAQEIRDGK
jgi:hypothetical protein